MMPPDNLEPLKQKTVRKSEELVKRFNALYLEPDTHKFMSEAKAIMGEMWTLGQENGEAKAIYDLRMKFLALLRGVKNNKEKGLELFLQEFENFVGGK